MHISDGVLPPEVWIPSLAVAGVGVTYILARKTEVEEIPKLSLVTAAVFVASLVHIPAGPTSVHFILSGLAGIILGWRALPAICVALILQAFLFQHGGITTLGVNTLIMGLPALAAYGVFWSGTRLEFRQKYAVFGGLAGGLAIASGAGLLYLCFLSIGESPGWLLTYVVVPHMAIVVIEAIVVGAFAEFVARVKPEILESYSTAQVVA